MPSLPNDVDIRSGDIVSAVAVSRSIPEFQNPHPESEYHRRLDGKLHLCLIAYKGNQAIGFKVGYEQGEYFYSWMGGVLPEYRRCGLATALMEAQHTWAKAKGFKGIEFKTRNGLKPMLIFGLHAGFDIIEVDRREHPAEHRIRLRKDF